MPRARWGIRADDVDEFDRSSQFKPYAGPIPPNGVYYFLVKRLKYAAATRDKLPQLRPGLELVPREDSDEDQYDGYYITAFLPVSDKTAFRYVPFLDAIGVTGSEFERRTVIDSDGSITRIGKWRNTGDTLIVGQLGDGTDEKGNSRKEIKWMGAAEENEELEEEEEWDSDE
jgi:hypothetical protein